MKQISEAQAAQIVKELDGYSLRYLIEAAAERLVSEKVLEDTNKKYVNFVGYALRVLGFGILKIIAENDRDTHDYSR